MAEPRAFLWRCGPGDAPRVGGLRPHSRNYQKRGGKLPQVSLDQAAHVVADQAAEVMALDDALQGLEQFDARKCRVVELRYFGGLTAEETAEVLGISVITVQRDWSSAKAWLLRAMSREGRDDA